MAGFGTQMLDVAIGMIFVYLILSLIASAFLEILETVLRTRAKYLWQGIGELLGDTAARASSTKPKTKTGAGRAAPAVSLSQVYQHPVINGLFFGDYDLAKRRLVKRALPAYIPRENFSASVIDLVSRENATPGLSSMESLRRGIAALPDSSTRRALEAIVRLAGDDIATVQAHIEAWYDTAMDRVAGWYKRHAQVILLVIGFALAVAANVDSWHLARDLANNEPKRQALVKSASDFAAAHAKTDAKVSGAEMKEYLGALDGLKRPLDSDREPWKSIPGWLITALAVSLGAPFWFDLLNKFMVVRSTVKPKEKSQDEGSQDRAATGGGTTGPRQPTSFVRTSG